MIDRRTMLAGLAAAPLSRASAATAATVATTRYGRVRGLRERGVLVFRGVRYGADTRPRRFQRALPPASWSGIADASKYGAASPQTAATEPTSEDCLFLNVWTPALDRG